MGRRGGMQCGLAPPHKQERDYLSHVGPTPKPGSQAQGTCATKRNPHEMWLLKPSGMMSKIEEEQ